MCWSLQSHRRRTFARAISPVCLIDALESRQLLSGETVATPLPAVLANVANPAANSLTLNQYFTDDVLPGSLATFSTTKGTIQVALTDAATPQTVANFISYVTSGEYTNTIFHRSVNIATGLGGQGELGPAASIVQGGGFDIENGTFAHIATHGTVPDEYTTALYGNSAGTLAMAKTSQANSATSEWYFNVTDNSVLNNPTIDGEGNQTSYTVFGSVLSGGNVLQSIAALPTYNDGANSGLTTIPVDGISQAQANAGVGIASKNLIFTNGITVEAGTTYTVTSSNKALVTPIVTNGVLSFSYSSTLYGTAEVTVKASNLDGTSTSTIVDVTVPNPASPGVGPVVPDFTAPFTQTGTTGNFSVVAGATDSVAALSPSTVRIVTGPTNGTASVDATTGHITYTPNTGFIGADSLTFTITDANGTVSNVATVTLNAVPTPTVVTIGTPKASTLTYTEPDGVVAHVSITDGTAAITFTDYRVTTTTANGVITATGDGAIITGMVIVNRGPFVKVNISSTGPINIGTVFSGNNVVSFSAPNATMTGTSFFGGVTKLTVAAAINATINLGKVVPSGLNIPNVSNTSVSAQESLTYIKSKQWLNTDGGTYTISGINILDLEVPGTFADNLTMAATGYSLVKANVGTPTGTWSMSGSMLKTTLGTPGANWGLTSGGLVTTLAIKGNLANVIQAAAIGTMTVSGTTTGAVIQTDANFSKSFTQIKKIAFTGAVSNTVIFSAGNVGTITAPSLASSRIYAGVELATAQAGVLPGAANLSNNAKISAVLLGNGVNAFSNVLIGADIIGSLKLGKINTANNGVAAGIAAHTISSITGTLSTGGTLKAGPAQLKTAAALAAYETASKLTLGDFGITLF